MAISRKRPLNICWRMSLDSNGLCVYNLSVYINCQGGRNEWFLKEWWFSLREVCAWSAWSTESQRTRRKELETRNGTVKERRGRSGRRFRQDGLGILLQKIQTALWGFPPARGFYEGRKPVLENQQWMRRFIIILKSLNKKFNIINLNLMEY